MNQKQVRDCFKSLLIADAPRVECIGHGTADQEKVTYSPMLAYLLTHLCLLTTIGRGVDAIKNGGKIIGAGGAGGDWDSIYENDQSDKVRDPEKGNIIHLLIYLLTHSLTCL